MAVIREKSASFVVVRGVVRGAVNGVTDTGFRSLALLAVAALMLSAAPVFAFAPSEPDAGKIMPETQTYSAYVMAYDKLDVEDRQGYNSEYIFGLSKGIMKSTLVPALKPFFLIFTAPLDLAFLPFSALAGFF